MRIEIALPVLNEAETLEPQILKILNFIKDNIFKEYEVSLIIGDNGSTDQTGKIAKRLSQENDNVEYVFSDKRGVGLILKKIWSQSQADIIGYMDLDLATDMAHLPEAIEAISKENYDIVYGSRLHTESFVTGRTPLRTFTSKAFNIICKKYMNTRFSDGMCGFKFLKQTIYPTLHKNGAKSDGWFFSTELLIVSEKLGLQLNELPVKWTDDPNSKVKIFKLATEYLKAMHELKANYPQIMKYNERK